MYCATRSFRAPTSSLALLSNPARSSPQCPKPRYLWRAIAHCLATAQERILPCLAGSNCPRENIILSGWWHMHAQVSVCTICCTGYCNLCGPVCSWEETVTLQSGISLADSLHNTLDGAVSCSCLPGRPSAMRLCPTWAITSAAPNTSQLAFVGNHMQSCVNIT